jgi:hypothetical protein
MPGRRLIIEAGALSRPYVGLAPQAVMINRGTGACTTAGKPPPLLPSSDTHNQASSRGQTIRAAGDRRSTCQLLQHTHETMGAEGRALAPRRSRATKRPDCPLRPGALGAGAGTDDHPSAAVTRRAVGHYGLARHPADRPRYGLQPLLTLLGHHARCYRANTAGQLPPSAVRRAGPLSQAWQGRLGDRRVAGHSSSSSSGSGLPVSSARSGAPEVSAASWPSAVARNEAT